MKKLYILGVFLLLALSVHSVQASSYPDGCDATTKYSATTGHICVMSPTCQPGDLYNSQTGQPCETSPYFLGCASLDGYSTVTGIKCDGALRQVVQSLINPSNTKVAVPIVTATVNADMVPPSIHYSSNMESRMLAINISNTSSIPVVLSTGSVAINRPFSYRVTALGGLVLGNGDDQHSFNLYPLSIPAGTTMEVDIYESLRNLDQMYIDTDVVTSAGFTATDVQGDVIFISAVSSSVKIVK